MNRKNGMILVFCFATSASAMDSLLEGPAFDPSGSSVPVFDSIFSSVSAFFASKPFNDKAAVIGAGITDAKNHLEVHNKKMIDGVVPHFGSTFTVKEQAGYVSKVKLSFESIKKNVMSVFASKSIEQEKVKEKSLLVQISENPGTTAALTAGTVVAFYGSYKLIQYFDNKKAKNIALKKRLKAQRMQASVVFE